MKIVQPGSRHSDAIIQRFVAESLHIAETDEEFSKTAARGCPCECKECTGTKDCPCSCPDCVCQKTASKVAAKCPDCPPGCTCKCDCHAKTASACPECGSAMLRKGNMERCACGYAQASEMTAVKKTAKEMSVEEYYRKIFPDDYASELAADKSVTPPAGEKVEYKNKPVDSKVSKRVTAREILAAEEAGKCEVPDAHPENGVSSGSGDTSTPDPKWQKGDSANSVSGPEKVKEHGAGDKPKEAGDVDTPDVKSANRVTAREILADIDRVHPAGGGTCDLSTEHTNSVSGPEKADEHGAGLKEPLDVKAPDLKAADRMIPREVVAKFCPECADEMARRGIKAVRASFIASQIAERAEARGFLQREAVSPPGWGGTVKKMKEHKEITNPFALAWYMKNKGDKPHYKDDK